jgi:benzoate-CoA ligase
VAASTATGVYNASTVLDANLAAGRGERVAISCGEERVTYGELFRRACGAGARLRELGVEAGDRVLLVMDDCAGFPPVFLGAIRIGAVPVPVNPLYAASEYDYFVSDSGASVAVVDAACAEKVAAARVVRVEELQGRVDDFPAEPTRADDMAFWLYSSGSTGSPKAVVHGQRDMLATCETYARHVLRIREDDVTFSTTKLFHAYGLGNGLSFPYWAGASTVLLPGRPTPEAVFEVVARERPTLVFSVPTLYNAMLHADAAQDWSSVRFCVSAAEPLPAEVWHRWHERHGLEILDGIGSTEMLHIYCSNRIGEVVPGSSGAPVPGYEVKLVDEHGQELEGEATGDLYVRGDSMLSGYWNQPERTADSIRDGWFYSRDRYRRDADGSYWYEGRADDMFKVSGLWVSPIDVEARLIEHPSVREAAVVAADAGGLTTAKAFVVCEASASRGDSLADELGAFCGERLHRYQVPRLIEFVDDLPKTVTGKILRYRLRER